MKSFRDIPNSELNRYIDEWIKNERDRKIMKRRFIDGICFEGLAEEYNLSVRQVKNIVKDNGTVIALKLHF